MLSEKFSARKILAHPMVKMLTVCFAPDAALFIEHLGSNTPIIPPAIAQYFERSTWSTAQEGRAKKDQGSLPGNLDRKKNTLSV